MKKAARIVVWLIISLIVLFVLFPIFRQKYFLHRIQNDPRLNEFERCTSKKYEFTYIEEASSNLKDLYLKKYSGVNFSYEDTLSAHGIKYYYTVDVKLDDNKIAQVMLGNTIRLDKDLTVRSIISDLEGDSALVQLITCTDIKKCNYNDQVFLFVGDKDTIKYDKTYGIAYAKLSSTPGELSALPHYLVFQKMTKNKGFASTDFDSLRYIKYSEIYEETFYDTWRIQGYIGQCGNDILEVGNYGVDKPHLKWLSIPDTINPIFLSNAVTRKLITTNLPTDYIEKNFALIDKGAIRQADYTKSHSEIYETSRVISYFTYRWHTDSWIDKLPRGLTVKIYSIIYINKNIPEAIHIGNSPSSFYDNILLHPLVIIDFNEIKQICSDIDTSTINFHVDIKGNIIMTFQSNDYRYSVNVETAEFTKENINFAKNNMPVIMHCGGTETQSLYGAAEGIVKSRRNNK